MRTQCPQSELIGNRTQTSRCCRRDILCRNVQRDASQITGVPGQIMSDMNTFSHVCRETPRRELTMQSVVARCNARLSAIF